MKIFEFRRNEWGIAFKRISDALHRYAPDWVEWTNYENCDIMIVHVVGGGEIPALEMPKPKVVIQHCYFTASAHEIDYAKYWAQSIMAVSFHDLRKYTDKDIPYYGMPWGADDNVFCRTNTGNRAIKVIATGHIAETEAIDKVYEAVKQLKQTLYHTGQNFGWDKRFYRYLDYMPDNEFAEVLNGTQYISALRFIEGFELMAIEGLFCGARPIIPDDPTYDWYREHAYTIVKDKDIVEQLVEILKDTPRPMDENERLVIVNKFKWSHLIGDFFTTLKQRIN
jgi:hypothetical protein